ncbi:MAG: ABC-ATPase domain-containing protein, partial [Methylococcaceae bacterium]|nr:ABC-ATPase domain-containing protein [Methylococcaceae bacterium]
MQKLKKLLDAITAKPYPEIQQLTGDFQFPRYQFRFLKIQGSPGANPASIVNLKVALEACELPAQFLSSAHCRLAVADFLIRRFKRGIEKFAQQNRGKEGSGSFNTIELSQKMLERDSVLFSAQNIELRFILSLPGKGAGGSKFDGQQAWLMLAQELALIVDYALYYKDYSPATKKQFAQYVDVQIKRQAIKAYMQRKGYIVFIANGAQLPRRSGIDDRPAEGAAITCFQAPESLQVDIPLGDHCSIRGMALKAGITCITGGGYHGKSTLLQAILAGVYAHIPGDGREYIVTREDAVFIRAEEGRSIRQVDISPFIGLLPNGVNTQQFSSENASGSTSQAASIVESLEIGSRLLLFDEDTCASNFLFRDALIEKVLDCVNEPIKPLYSVVRSMWQQQDVSMIFVVGGLGRFLQKAETCLLMNNYQCQDISSKVRAVLGEIAKEKSAEPLHFAAHRRLTADNFSPVYINDRLKKEVPIRIKPLRNAPRQLEYGMDLINLEALPQIVEAPQMLSVGYCLLRIRQAMQNSPDKAQTINDWLHW